MDKLYKDWVKSMCEINSDYIEQSKDIIVPIPEVVDRMGIDLDEFTEKYRYSLMSFYGTLPNNQGAAVLGRIGNQGYIKLDRDTCKMLGLVYKPK